MLPQAPPDMAMKALIAFGSVGILDSRCKQYCSLGPYAKSTYGLAKNTTGRVQENLEYLLGVSYISKK